MENIENILGQINCTNYLYCRMMTQLDTSLVSKIFSSQNHPFEKLYNFYCEHLVKRAQPNFFSAENYLH